MKVLQPGRLYQLDEGYHLPFVHATGSGTTNEEILEVLIDRTQTLNNEYPCDENVAALGYMRAALEEFKKRAERVGNEDQKKYVLVKTSRVYYGGPGHGHDKDDLDFAIFCAKEESNPIGYDVYLKVPKSEEVQHPVWKFHDQDSYKKAVDQIDPLHDGVE